MTQTPEFIVVAIDGGAASGKSSTARGLASRFTFLHVDTGSHYRAITHLLLDAGISPDDAAGVGALLADTQLGTRIESGQARLTINGGEPDASALRSQAVNANVSQVAALERVRRHLFQYQRSQAGVAQEHGFRGMVMEGRDIGSVIFPDAPFRFFLEADVATRERRRAREGLTDSIDARDRMDTTRKTAPLKCPQGAVRIDTSKLTLEQVVDDIAARIQAPTPSGN